VTHLIKHHIPEEHHQEIYNKLKDSMSKSKGIDSEKALAHLRKHLKVKD
jgi:replicative DNA helicase